ncbi:MAG: ABC transporter substrate-binding protein [Bacteroidota bacterium]
MMKHIWIILLIAIAACGNPQNQSKENLTNTVEASEPAFIPEVKYAKHFAVSVNEAFKTVIVYNPWEEGDTLASYLLYPKGTKAPDAEWAEFKIPVPIEKVVATSSPHVGFVGLIQELDKITGVAEDRYIYSSYLYEKIGRGEVGQVGSLKNSNLEVLLDLSPDLVMKTGVDNVKSEDARLIDAGVAVSYNVEWMENNMLARAEWVKLVGAFFNKDQMADSIFKEVEREYLRALAATKEVKNRPFVMTGNNFKGTWYMPSAESYITKLINDAGGDYKYKNEVATGSLPLSFEVVLDDMIDADFWIGPRAQSMKELEARDERYELFKSFREGNVYTFNKRTSKNGGNDYWESGMTRPDIILKDVIKIFHPELLPEHELYYYKKLQ